MTYNSNLSSKSGLRVFLMTLVCCIWTPGKMCSGHSCIRTNGSLRPANKQELKLSVFTLVTYIYYVKSYTSFIFYLGERTMIIVKTHTFHPLAFTGWGSIPFG